MLLTLLQPEGADYAYHISGSTPEFGNLTSKPLLALGTPQGGGVHGPPSLPSQSPHNMPQPQPSPQPSQTQQQQQQQQVSNPVPSGRQAVQVNKLKKLLKKGVV